MTDATYTKWLHLLRWVAQHPDKRAALVTLHGTYEVRFTPRQGDQVYQTTHPTYVDADPTWVQL